MIKANELRIGNYIKLGGSSIDTYQTYKPYKVSADAIKEIADENEERGNDYILSVFQPIKLTPEILEKCGFVKDGGDYDFKELTFQWWQHENILHWVSSSGDVSVSLPYLHQLQNLYFALTGQELMINI